MIDTLLFELPSEGRASPQPTEDGGSSPVADERSPLIQSGGTWRSLPVSDTGDFHDGQAEGHGQMPDATGSGLAEQLQGLNALEIAAVSGAKKFLSQKPILKITNAIWVGEIVFWPSLSPNAQKHAQIYQMKSMDPYCRLRVPVYLKAFEVLFFLAFLTLYYIVLVQRSFTHITTSEILLYVWILSFAYNGGSN